VCLNCYHICQKPFNFRPTYAFKCYQNNVTCKNVSWPHFSWATLYSKSQHRSPVVNFPMVIQQVDHFALRILVYSRPVHCRLHLLQPRFNGRLVTPHVSSSNVHLFRKKRLKRISNTGLYIPQPPPLTQPLVSSRQS